MPPVGLPCRCGDASYLGKGSHLPPQTTGLPHVRENQGKTKFSPGQGILENVREFLPFDSHQGIVREFFHDIFRLRLHHMVRDLPGLW